VNIESPKFKIICPQSLMNLKNRFISRELQYDPKIAFPQESAQIYVSPE